MKIVATHTAEQENIIRIDGKWQRCIIRNGQIQRIVRPLSQEECDRLLSKEVA